VVTVKGADDLAGYALARFEELSADGRSRTGRGLLLVIDPAGRAVRLEVSRSLEGAFPDAFIAYIEQRQMVPFFAADRVADGILATTELIVARAQDATRAAALDQTERATVGAGAGATASTAGAAPRPAFDTGTYAAQPTPKATLALYLAAMDARNGDASLGIYSRDTQAMLAGRVMTPAQMDGVVRAYRSCQPEPAQVGNSGSRAVIRYAPAERACAPWFFVREGAGWRLDLTMMQRAIRFGRSNAWRLVPGVDHPYDFAFEDWRFDKNGFPRVN
jgi:uncharacterized protein